MCEPKFFICEHCGNLVEMINESGVPMMCCGQKMTRIEAGTVDASREKHVPVITVEGNTVRVDIGSVAHPMAEEHSILWVYLQTTAGGQLKYLSVGSEPTVTFTVGDETPLAAYAYCNLHGLWMEEIKEVPVCNLKPVDTSTKENYVVCNCNNVTYFDILDEIHKHEDVNNLLEVFESVKNTTHCSTGCGGCYDKVIHIISDTMTNGDR